MARAFRKDIWRTITQSRKRFVSILVICALGVTMVTGLRASCFDLRASADAFFDSQHLYDISIQSTLGLSAEDVQELAHVEGVDKAEGAWEETTYTDAGSQRLSVDVKALSADGINAPYIVEGSLPTNENEVAVTQNFLTTTGLSLGDTVTLEKSSDAVFKRVDYIITASVIDPTELTSPTGPIAIRASASSDCCFFVTQDAVDPEMADAFTIIYLIASNTEGTSCYSDEYTATIDELVNRIENLRADRELARTNEIKQDAHAAIDEEEATAQDEFASAESQLADAQKQIDDGWAELNASKEQLASGQQQLESSQAQLDEQAAQLADARTQLEDGLAQVAEGRAQLEASIEPGKAAINTQIDAQIDQLNEQFDNPSNPETDLPAEMYQQYLAALQQIESARTEALNSFDATIAENRATLDTTEQQLRQQLDQVATGETALSAGRAQLDSSKQELATGTEQLANGEAELRAGQEELDSQRSEYEASKADALQQIADARAEVDDIEQAQWYVQTRDSNAGYTSVESDASSIEAIGLVFPVVFIIVAVLIALTTITRMVEEERSLIGTYKSLGYSRHAILMKYLAYSLGASLLGGLLGEFCGFIAFPTFLFSVVFEAMYQIPEYLYSFDTFYGIGSILFFIVGIAGAAVIACRSELKQTPAALMRPKAPKAGSRILLERITPLWKRMSFLNKVTARNIFRYKKRFLMTIFGIMGCMALLVCGFAIRDSVHALSDMQYNDINRYDVLAVVNQDDFDSSLTTLEEDSRISEVQPLGVDSVTVSAATADTNGSADLTTSESGAEAAETNKSNAETTNTNTASTNSTKESLQLFIAPDGAPLTDFINTRTSADSPCELTDGGILLTRNAAELLGIGIGSNVHIETSTLDQANVPVQNVIDNYLGNAAYITESTYEEYFGNTADLNGFFINLVSNDAAQQEVFADELASNETFMSVTSTQKMSEEFSQSFQLINTVVYVIIVLAAALAFVVLFTLSTTNISERIRELATIKVLGFRKREVNHYVNKETILLTALGMIAGIPLGYAFSQSLTYVLKMPSIYFAVTIEPISYAYACALTLFFAWLVALLSNRALAKIDMIEALKSVE